MAKAAGGKGRKLGRGQRKPAHKRYLSDNRSEKNKAKRIAKQKRKEEKKRIKRENGRNNGGTE